MPAYIPMLLVAAFVVALIWWVCTHERKGPPAAGGEA